MSDLPLRHGNITEKVIGCFYEVYDELGHGFSETVLRRSMIVALRQKGMQTAEHVPLEVRFRGVPVGSFFADLVVEKAVLVEIKATSAIEPYAVPQLLNYLKAAGGGVGLLLNFGVKPDFKRRVMGDPENSLPFIS
jgi:GxxExxY protein